MAADADLARYYDLDLEGYADDVDMYLALAGRRAHAVLELACGSGRIAIPLAEAGHEVVGVDVNKSMMARAQGKWDERTVEAKSGTAGSLTLIEGDITALDLRRRFELVILGLNSLPLIGDREAQTTALRVAAAHLAADGRLVIDTYLPSPADLAAYDGTLELAWRRRDPATGAEVAKLWSADYEATTATATVTTFFDTWPASGGHVHRMARRDELHLIGVSELVALAGKAGLTVDTLAGSYDMSPLTADSERAVLVLHLL